LTPNNSDARYSAPATAIAIPSITALLNKINGANVLGRDAEAQMMDAHLFQWRYGTAYGRDLFSRTAANLDAWRQP
jgi:hypothetical protein